MGNSFVGLPLFSLLLKVSNCGTGDFQDQFEIKFVTNLKYAIYIYRLKGTGHDCWMFLSVCGFDNINNQKNPDSAKYKKTFCKDIYKKQPHIGKQGESVQQYQ